jgi:predicted ArsR family transcriptional regulator
VSANPAEDPAREPEAPGDETTSKRVPQTAEEKERNARAKVEAHPLRLDILAILDRGGTASPNQLAIELDRSLNLVAYHVRILEKYGCVQLIDTEQRRGATEHFYVSTGKVTTMPPLALGEPHRAMLVQLVDDHGLRNGYNAQQRSLLIEARTALLPAVTADE